MFYFIYFIIMRCLYASSAHYLAFQLVKQYWTTVSAKGLFTWWMYVLLCGHFIFPYRSDCSIALRNALPSFETLNPHITNFTKRNEIFFAWTNKNLETKSYCHLRLCQLIISADFLSILVVKMLCFHFCEPRTVSFVIVHSHNRTVFF